MNSVYGERKGKLFLRGERKVGFFVNLGIKAADLGLLWILPGEDEGRERKGDGEGNERRRRKWRRREWRRRSQVKLTE